MNLIIALVHVPELVMAHVKVAAEGAALIIVLAHVAVCLTKFNFIHLSINE